jgi:hypothetical protein
MRTINRLIALGLALLAACGGGDAPAAPAVDSAALADSLAQAARAEAHVLVDSAKTTLATLLDNPATATFDSVVVIQPPPADGRSPAMAACGRIGGRPGIGGSRTPVRFIYQGKWTVFVEESRNAEQFAGLWAKLCAAPGAEVVMDER